MERIERDKDGGTAWDRYEEIIRELDARLEVGIVSCIYSSSFNLRISKSDIEAAKGKTLEELSPIDEATGFPVLPHWLAQPYIRPLPAEPEAAKPPRENNRSGVEVVGEFVYM